MRIKSFPRFIISMIIIFLCLISLINVVLSKVVAADVISYEEVMVCNGDTLWSIASKLNGNINENIYEIKMANNMNTSEIFIGQTLKIPVK